MSEIAMEKVFK